MKNLPNLIAAASLFASFGFIGTVQATVAPMLSHPQIAQPIQGKALRSANQALARDLAQPTSRRILCHASGRQAFSMRTCAALGLLQPQADGEGRSLSIDELKANRALWQSLPMRVRQDLETYDVVEISRQRTNAPQAPVGDSQPVQ